MGALVAFAVIVVTSSLVGAHTVLANYPATILPLENPRVMALMMDDIFMQAHTHAAPFTVGICTGYLIGASPFMRLRPVGDVAYLNRYLRKITLVTGVTKMPANYTMTSL